MAISGTRGPLDQLLGKKPLLEGLEWAAVEAQDMFKSCAVVAFGDMVQWWTWQSWVYVWT